MNAIDRALNEFRSLDEMAGRDSALARLDPRAKLLVTLLFIVVVLSFDRYQIASLLPFALFPIAAAVWGEMPLRPLLRKLMLALPFALMVGLFNPWFDRAPMLEIAGVTVSAGWVSLGAILVRFALSMSAALLLVATTGMNAVASALGQLGAPRAFSSQLLFLYRYLFVLGEEASHMATAAQLRSGGQPKLSFEVWTKLMGQLLVRAYERAQRIHMAMLARGFDGEPRSLRRLKWTPADTRFTLLCGAAFLLVRTFDLPQLLGEFLLRIAG